MQELIEHILTELDIEYDVREEYIHTHSPFTDDAVKSCVIYLNDGTMSIFNGCVDNKNRLTLKEWCVSLGFGNEYVEYMLNFYDIPIYKFNKYKDIIQKKAIGNYYNYNELKELRQTMRELYLKDSEVLGLSNSKPIINKYNKKSNKKKSKIVEKDLTNKDKNAILQYMKKRKLGVSESCYPTIVNINDLFDIKAICFKYPNGFKKFRLLSNGLRYLSLGNYETLYEVRVNKTKTLIICEGEIEAHSLESVAKCDLMALHNVNSVKIQNDFSSYINVIVLLDNDKYEEVKERVLKDIKSFIDCNIKILPKFNSSNKALDLNSFLIKEGEESLKKHLTNVCL